MLSFRRHLHGLAEPRAVGAVYPSTIPVFNDYCSMARKADPTIRGRLLEASRIEFAEHGLDGAHLSNITARAGVSKGAFYLHFRSKEDAFEEVAEEFFGRFFDILDRFEQIAQSDIESPEVYQAMHNGDCEIMECLWQERAFARVLFEGAHSPRQIHLIERFAKRIQERVERLLAIDLGRGRLLANTNIRPLAQFIAGGFDRYARVLLASSEKPDIRQDLAELQRFICRGAMTPDYLESLGLASERPTK
jgi:AcrR family transcriptional regulator